MAKRRTECRGGEETAGDWGDIGKPENIPPVELAHPDGCRTSHAEFGRAVKVRQP
jgi:hypothetical protein